MEAVIPPDVLEHLRTLAEAETSLEGLFTTRMMAEEMGCGDSKAREVIRDLLRNGKVRLRRVGLTDEMAAELGYLGGTSLKCYEWVQAA